MKCPSKVLVLSHVFKIKWVKVDVETMGAFGKCNFNKHVLAMPSGMSRTVKAEALMHELIHAIHWQMGVDDGSKEEDITRSMSVGLCTVWQQNPELFRWMGKNLSHG